MGTRVVAAQRFAAVVMRIRDPKTTALIFGSGKIVVTGGKTEEQTKLAARQSDHFQPDPALLSMSPLIHRAHCPPCRLALDPHSAPAHIPRVPTSISCAAG